MRFGTIVAGVAAALLAFGQMARPAAGDVQAGGGSPTSLASLPSPAGPAGSAEVPPATIVPATVTIDAAETRVIDGSTLDAVVGGVRLAVGYLGAATPPGNTPCGVAAKARNAELAGILVRLESDPAYERDATGRRLYYAYSADGDLIDAVLVREGLARATGGDGARAAELGAAEAQARETGAGCIWGTSPAA